MLFPCRLLVDPPAVGAWNMAVDEALLESAAAGDPVVWLRFYAWSEPTLSLGYFQPFARWTSHVARNDCTVVRRQTGGGAILHDRELTYSLVLPPRHPLAQGGGALYSLVHEALLSALARFGIVGGLWKSGAPQAVSADEPFLCFQRRAPSDVVLWPTAGGSDGGSPSDLTGPANLWPLGHKICGSAQRRSRGALLMHGSLLLGASSITPQLLGIKELAGISLRGPVIAQRWLGEILRRLNSPSPQQCTPSENIRQRAAFLAQTKYSAENWTVRR